MVPLRVPPASVTAGVMDSLDAPRLNVPPIERLVIPASISFDAARDSVAPALIVTAWPAAMASTPAGEASARVPPATVTPPVKVLAAAPPIARVPVPDRSRPALPETTPVMVSEPAPPIVTLFVVRASGALIVLATVSVGVDSRNEVTDSVPPPETRLTVPAVPVCWKVIELTEMSVAGSVMICAPAMPSGKTTSSPGAGTLPVLQLAAVDQMYDDPAAVGFQMSVAGTMRLSNSSILSWSFLRWAGRSLRIGKARSSSTRRLNMGECPGGRNQRINGREVGELPQAFSSNSRTHAIGCHSRKKGLTLQPLFSAKTQESTAS